MNDMTTAEITDFVFHVFKHLFWIATLAFLVLALFLSRNKPLSEADQRTAMRMLGIMGTVLPLYLIALTFIYQNYTPGMFTKACLIVVLIFLVPCLLTPISMLVRGRSILIRISMWSLASALLTIIFVMWLVITEIVSPK